MLKPCGFKFKVPKAIEEGLGLSVRTYWRGRENL